ncbi:bifunctional 4-hydroxy-2-oxoglutarate aldolase/2-dehydro-3-deoxy-phosphogluconate aldolase [Paenibacillus sp. CC-CFT747]|nr:bifunctional 4-hydroxy-2-oxoglutarate aldolase/2-dehydro-3-deoxy-phosphogluconate aldolase [Paenibacillus sp. CC-CFT747]
MNREQGLRQIEDTRIVAIVRGVEPKHIQPVAEALLQGGITVMEVTLNTVGALDSIRELRQAMDGRMFIGAGTVLDREDAQRAVEAGASFLVTPNVDEEAIRYAADRQLPVFPGAMTPTEIVKAWKAGATAVKLFPSASFGLSFIKELRGPLGHIPMVAVGGVNEGNLSDYLKAGCYAVGIGSSLFPLADIAKGRYDAVTAKARSLTDSVTRHHARS